MKKATLRFGKGFKVVVGNPCVQAAQMVIAPGDSEGGPKNRHRGSDQWLIVVAGIGALAFLQPRAEKRVRGVATAPPRARFAQP